jgi:PAS domain S-box-containing protein
MQHRLRRSSTIVWLDGEGSEDARILEELVGASPFGIAIFDLDLRYRLVNDWLARMNGPTAEEHLGRIVAEVVPSLAEQARSVADRIILTGQTLLNHEFTGDTEVLPGVRRFRSETWYPIFRDGQVGMLGAFVEEVTEKSSLERQLREAIEQKDVFIASLTHELRNVLAPAVTALRVLKLADDGDRRERMVQIIERNRSAVSGMLDDLLNVGRFSRLNKAPFDLQATLRGCGGEHESPFRKRPRAARERRIGALRGDCG